MCGICSIRLLPLSPTCSYIQNSTSITLTREKQKQKTLEKKSDLSRIINSDLGYPRTESKDCIVPDLNAPTKFSYANCFHICRTSDGEGGGGGGLGGR